MARKGLLIDTSLCIGCRGCQVACKQWNQRPGVKTKFEGTYENPIKLSSQTWQRVRFVEHESSGAVEWLFMPDTCKHCSEASCMEVCPAGAINRTEVGTILLDGGLCIGCRNCVQACPFHVPGFNKNIGVTEKCTFCIDRVNNGLKTACATVCPTGAINFGNREGLLEMARNRLNALKAVGKANAQIYGEKELGGLGVTYLLLERPSVYGLPEEPEVATKGQILDYFTATVAGAILLFTTIASFRERGRKGGE
jgi:formate dehydrogenase iron-sulfur subunit